MWNRRRRRPIDGGPAASAKRRGGRPSIEGCPRETRTGRGCFSRSHSPSFGEVPKASRAGPDARNQAPEYRAPPTSHHARPWRFSKHQPCDLRAPDKRAGAGRRSKRLRSPGTSPADPRAESRLAPDARGSELRREDEVDPSVPTTWKRGGGTRTSADFPWACQNKNLWRGPKKQRK